MEYLSRWNWRIFLTRMGRLTRTTLVFAVSTDWEKRAGGATWPMLWNGSRTPSVPNTWSWAEEMPKRSRSCLRTLAWATTGTPFWVAFAYGGEKPSLCLFSFGGVVKSRHGELKRNA